MKTTEFLKEAVSELDQLIDKHELSIEPKPGLTKQSISKVGTDLKKSSGALSSAIKTQATHGRSFAVTSPSPQETAKEKTADAVRASASQGEKVNVDPKVKNYMKQLAGGKQAQQGTGTPEVDSALRSVGLMK